MEIRPFFINSNICLDVDDISTFERFMTTIAGNTGNSYITYALIKEVFGGLIKINHIPNIYDYNFDNQDKDIDFINNSCTHVFLILQDQIRICESYGLQLPYENIMNFIKKLNKPVIIAGLGVNSFNGFDKDFHTKLNPNLIKFLKFLSEHCIEIGIRGHYTQEVLHNIGIDNVNPIGCPSFYEMGSNRIIQKKEITSSKSILLSQYSAYYNFELHAIMQDFQEEDIIKLIAYNRIERIENQFDEIKAKNIYNQKYHIFCNIEDWKIFVKSFNFTIGYRLHGSILSLNSGVPALCMNGDSRATEMCNLLKIPHNANIKINSINDIIEIYNSLDYSEMNQTYNQLYDNFKNFMYKNNILLFGENDNSYEYIQQPKLQLYKNEIFCNLSNNYQIQLEISNIRDNLYYEPICQYNFFLVNRW